MPSFTLKIISGAFCGILTNLIIICSLHFLFILPVCILVFVFRVTEDRKRNWSSHSPQTLSQHGHRWVLWLNKQVTGQRSVSILSAAAVDESVTDSGLRSQTYILICIHKSILSTYFSVVRFALRPVRLLINISKWVDPLTQPGLGPCGASGPTVPSAPYGF